MPKIKVVGAGLAGCEAAYYIANKGYKLDLYEMKKINRVKKDNDYVIKVGKQVFLRGPSYASAGYIIQIER